MNIVQTNRLCGGAKVLGVDYWIATTASLFLLRLLIGWFCVSSRGSRLRWEAIQGRWSSGRSKCHEVFFLRTINACAITYYLYNAFSHCACVTFQPDLLSRNCATIKNNGQLGIFTGSTAYSGLYGEAPHEKGLNITLEVYKGSEVHARGWKG